MVANFAHSTKIDLNTQKNRRQATMEQFELCNSAQQIVEMGGGRSLVSCWKDLVPVVCQVP